jgi:hypothetical protein
MKNFRILFLMAVLAAGLTACQKDEEVKGMAGTWEGLWGFDQDVPSYYERWEFKKNGDFTAFDYDGDVYAKGNFNLDGTIFTAEYTSEGSGSQYRFKGDYDENIHKITGTWGLSPSYTNRGLFEMTKQ